MDILNLANKLLSALTILLQVFLFFSIIYFLLFRKYNNRLWLGIKEKGATLALIIAMAATLGSLFYSEVAGYLPCELCWYQRIAMYPLVILIFMSIWRRERAALDYSLILAVIGLAFSGYHNYIYFKSSSGVCSLDGVSCLTQYMTEFSYITIPVMSLTAFSAVVFLLLISNREGKDSVF